MKSDCRENNEAFKALSAFLALVRASEALTTRLSFGSENKGLTVSQIGVLEALYRGGTHCQKELGAKIFKSSGNITLVIDNLEKRGLVKRERQGEDRRFISVHLTKEGREVISEALPKCASFIQENMKVLTMAEQEKLMDICRRLICLGEK